MDAHEPGSGGSSDGGRPLTRRELRARATGVQTPQAWPVVGDVQRDIEVPAPDGGPLGEWPADVDVTPTGTGAAPDASDTSDAAGRTDHTGPADPSAWEVAVGWSVRHELPAALPPEPDEGDDVRWDPVGVPDAVRVDELHPAETPARAAWATEGGIEAWAPTPPQTRAARRRAESGPESGTEPGVEPGAGPGDLPDDVQALGGATDLDPAGAPQGADDPDATQALELPLDADEPGEGDDLDDTDDDGQPRRVSVLGGPPSARPQAWHVGASFGPVTPVGGAVDPVGAPAAAPYDEQVVPAATPVVVPPQPAPSLPTLDDLLATRRPAPSGPAEIGWRGVVRRITGGVIALPPGVAEREDRDAVASVQRSLDGPRTVVVINPKGGAHKTTATLMIAATFGRHRGGYTLAWDNNETRGTLGWRSRHAHHRNTAVDLLDDLERFADPGSSRVGDLDNYVRSQASAQFDVLASDEDAASAASIDDFAFRALHRTLTRFYRVLVIDTGNNMRASNWQAAIEAADQVVLVSTMREDTSQSAAWALDALRASGHGDVVRRAVTVLSQPAPRRDAELATRLHDHFGRLTRSVHEVPYEPALVPGGPIDYDALSDATRRAWLHVTAAVAEGL